MLFVDREEELKFLESYVNSFPKPSLDLPRSRQVLVLIGPKGVGKSALLRKFCEKLKERNDVLPVYIEFRGPYESIDDLTRDILVQLWNQFKEVKQSWKDIGKKVLKALAVKFLGKEVIEVIEESELVEKFLGKSIKPTYLIQFIEYELCKLTGEEDMKLITIYDEFQEFLKVILTDESRYKILADSFITYLSKTQESGFSDTKGYPIRIISTSDYTFILLMKEHLGIYLRLYYIDDLNEEFSKILLKTLLEKYGIEYSELTIDYMAKVLGGNPSIIIEFVRRVIDKQLNYIDVVDVEQIVNELIKEIESRLDIVKTLEQFYKIYGYGRLTPEGKRVLESLLHCLGSEYSWKSLFEITSIINEKVVLEFIRRNILCWRNNEVRFQNKLMMYAFRKNIETILKQY